MSKNLIVVTGGAGFIGSHLVQKLVKNPDNEVYSLDDYSSGTIQNHVEGVKYINSHTKDIEKNVTFVPKIIYHLGQYSRTSASFSDPNFVWQQNCHGTFKVIEFCRKNKVRLLYAASSTKMADEGQGKNQSPYAWTKSTNVDLLNRYGEWYNLDFTIVYFYNVYGGREIREGEYATLIALWKQCVKKGQKPKLVSPGTQLRSFTYYQDVIDGIILAGEKGKGDGYPLGAEEIFTLWDVGKMFGFQNPQSFEILPPKPGDRKTAVIDLERTRSDLGWKAKTKLRDHIKQFLEEQQHKKIENQNE